MNETIYDLLNDMEQDLGQYGEEQMTRAEIRDNMKVFRKRIAGDGARGGAKKRYAAAIALVLIGAGVVFRAPVSATVENLVCHLQDFFTMKEELSSYSIPINKELYADDMIVTLKEAIIDEDDIFLLYSLDIEGDDGTGRIPYTARNNEFSILPEIYRNGEFLPCSCGAGAKRINGEDVWMADLSLPRDTDVSKECEYEVIFRQQYHEKTEENAEFFESGKELGSVSFTGSGEKMIGARKREKIDREFTLENGCVLRLDELVTSPAQCCIYATLVSGEPEDFYRYENVLEGTDNLGRRVCFNMTDWEEDHGKFLLDYDFRYGVDMTDVKSFTLKLSSRKLPDMMGVPENVMVTVDTKFEQVGEEFTISK